MRMNAEYWKRKLMAFLHDPPCKCFGIGEHENIASAFQTAAGIMPEECKNFAIQCDATAAAADRFPFPKDKCATTFKGDANSPFIHPLCGSKLSTAAPSKVAPLLKKNFRTVQASYHLFLTLLSRICG